MRVTRYRYFASSAAMALLGACTCAFGQYSPPSGPGYPQYTGPISQIVSGDPGGGFNGAISTPVISDAFDLQGGGTSATVQGVTLYAGSANVTFSGSPTSPYGGYSVAPLTNNDANGAAMTDVMSGLLYTGSPGVSTPGGYPVSATYYPISMTLLGLTAGQTYQLQLLVGENQGRWEDLNINGTDLGAFATYDVTNHTVIPATNVDPTFVALGGGNDVITLAGYNSNTTNFWYYESTLVSGIVVSPVPEPASLGLLAGLLPLLAARRRRS
jgi:hypothetical protein